MMNSNNRFLLITALSIANVGRAVTFGSGNQIMLNSNDGIIGSVKQGKNNTYNHSILSGFTVDDAVCYVSIGNLGSYIKQ